MDDRIYSIVVVGAGLTGSHFLPQVGRMACVVRVIIVDPEYYEAANRLAQNIDTADVGKPKAWVQARKIRRCNPDLRVEAIVARIEDVPLARLACSVIVSCLDSRAARQIVNEVAFRLGMPLVDCGVLGSQNLARVTVYHPYENAPCLECNWGAEDYAQVEQEYPCAKGGAPHRPTMASSALGSLAASLAALEVGKVLAEEPGPAANGYEVVVDAQHHKMLLTTRRRNLVCRFDHRQWVIDRWECAPRTTTVWSAVQALGAFRVDGHRFVTHLSCPACGRSDDGLKLNRPLKTCLSCRRRMVPPGFDARTSIDSNLPDEYRRLTLAQIGLRLGDVITCGERHFVLAEKTV